jgi:hypothetical protein
MSDEAIPDMINMSTIKMLSSLIIVYLHLFGYIKRVGSNTPSFLALVGIS